MSQENVELVRSIYAAWERGSFGETYWVDPGIDFQAIGETPSAGTWKGFDGMATAWREWLSAWQEFHVEADEYRELDGGRVLVLGRFAGRGRDLRPVANRMAAAKSASGLIVWAI